MREKERENSGIASSHRAALIVFSAVRETMFMKVAD